MCHKDTGRQRHGGASVAPSLLQCRTNKCASRQQLGQLGHTQRGIIPAALDIDRCPIPCSDGADAVWIADEEVPGGGACVDDGLVTVPDPGAELVGAEVIPDVSIGFSSGE
jgi:hypothetical protein